MVATFEWREYTTSIEYGVPTSLNFGSFNIVDLSPLQYPVLAGENSYSKVLVARFTTISDKVFNVKIWKSSGEYVDGEAVKFKCVAVYEVPSETDIVGADIPTEQPQTNNVSIGGSLSGELLTDGQTDYIVLQKQIAATASPGVTNTLIFTVQYDEI